MYMKLEKIEKDRSIKKLKKLAKKIEKIKKKNQNASDMNEDEADLLTHQKQAVDILMKMDEREILWIYSIVGNLGKSKLKEYLMKEHSAITIDPFKPADVKSLLQRMKKAKETYQSEDNETPCIPHEAFFANPIIVVDLSRAAGSKIKRQAMYETIEDIQTAFHNTKFVGCNFLWEKPPHILVLANEPPATHFFTPDRLQTYIIGRLDAPSDANIRYLECRMSIRFRETVVV